MELKTAYHSMQCPEESDLYPKYVMYGIDDKVSVPELYCESDTLEIKEWGKKYNSLNNQLISRVITPIEGTSILKTVTKVRDNKPSSEIKEKLEDLVTNCFTQLYSDLHELDKIFNKVYGSPYKNDFKFNDLKFTDPKSFTMYTLYGGNKDKFDMDTSNEIFKLMIELQTKSTKFSISITNYGGLCGKQLDDKFYFNWTSVRIHGDQATLLADLRKASELCDSIISLLKTLGTKSNEVFSVYGYTINKC